MKAILEFELPEEREDYDMAINGHKFRIMLDELDMYLRNKLKYETLTDLEHDIYSTVREELIKIVNDRE